jgi:hypothetical protein
MVPGIYLNGACVFDKWFQAYMGLLVIAEYHVVPRQETNGALVFRKWFHTYILTVHVQTYVYNSKNKFHAYRACVTTKRFDRNNKPSLSTEITIFCLLIFYPSWTQPT